MNSGSGDVMQPTNVYPINSDSALLIEGSAKIPQYGLIESNMRSTINSLVNSKYNDEFDWSIYDKIASKFPVPPKWGVVFKTGLKLANSHPSCSKCHYSLEIDTYGRGCVHDCGYCYAKEQLTNHGIWNKPQPFPVDISAIRKIFYTVFETDKKSKWRSILSEKIPLRLGSMSDCFMWMDTKYGVTKELLKILKFYRYPYIVFTRSDLVAHDQYINLLDRNLCSIQFSISGNNSKLMRVIEPGAPSYKRRLAALKKLSENDFWTTVRINPMLPLYPDGYFSDRESVIRKFGGEKHIPTIPFYDEELFSDLSNAAVPSVLVGFVRLSTKAVASITESSGVELKSFFTESNWLSNGHKRYSDAEILAYYEWAHSNCKKYGIRFSTCYIGNGLKDYYQHQFLWDNKKDCCDAVGNVSSFTKTSQSIPWNQRLDFSANKSEGLKAQINEEQFDLIN